jgi:hypothetical protein
MLVTPRPVVATDSRCDRSPHVERQDLMLLRCVVTTLGIPIPPLIEQGRCQERGGSGRASKAASGQVFRGLVEAQRLIIPRLVQIHSISAQSWWTGYHTDP